MRLDFWPRRYGLLVIQTKQSYYTFVVFIEIHYQHYQSVVCKTHILCKLKLTLKVTYMYKLYNFQDRKKKLAN
jgi:hypothetical protein